MVPYLFSSSNVGSSNVGREGEGEGEGEVVDCELAVEVFAEAVDKTISKAFPSFDRENLSKRTPRTERRKKESRRRREFRRLSGVAGGAGAIGTAAVLEIGSWLWRYCEGDVWRVRVRAGRLFCGGSEGGRREDHRRS